MRFVALLVVVAIIYVVWARRSPVTSTAEAMKEADAVAPTPATRTVYPPTHTPAPSGPTGLRAPIDRTRSVLDQVKQRNGKGEF